MGITGLLPFLKKIQRDVHLSSFRGRKVAVDAYSWLHKGAYSCALQLVMKSDRVENLPFIKYCIRRVNLLRQHDIQPIMVFDGGYLPTKSGTEKERRERRDTYRQKGKALMREGKKSEAVECFQKCVDVTPEMALAVIKECRAMGVECIVAPYEADAQLAFLERVSLVDLVITEDSDLLAFGCKRVLFKLDDCGNGKLIELQEMGRANDTLVGFNPDSFRHMCILSGCDYLPSVPGVGLGRASKLMKKFNQDPYRVIKSLQFETGKVPEGYEAAFRRADHTFLYQMVFDPRTQKQVRLNEPPPDLDLQDLEFAGVESSPRKAIGMARGNLNPLTQEVMDTYSPSKAPPPKSIGWNASAMGSSKKPYPVAGQVTLMNFVSSKKSKAGFKPPKKVEVEDQSLNDDELQAMYGVPNDVSTLYGVPNDENLDASRDDEATRVSSHVVSNVITVSRYFAKPTSSTPFSVPQPSCPKRPHSSEKPSALQVLDCTSSQSTTSCAEEQLIREGEESICSIPESPMELPGTAMTSAQSLPDLSSRTRPLSGFSAKKRLSFVLKESCDKSHDTLRNKSCDKSYDTSCDKSHFFAKRPKVVLDIKMANLSTKEQVENTDPDNEDSMNQDGSLGGTQDGSLGGTQDGSLGDTQDGSLGGTQDGSLGGTQDGSLGGTQDGSLGGTQDGSLGGTQDGSLGGTQDGSLGGTQDGSLGGTQDGSHGSSSVPLGSVEDAHVDNSSVISCDASRMHYLAETRPSSPIAGTAVLLGICDGDGVNTELSGDQLGSCTSTRSGDQLGSSTNARSGDQLASSTNTRCFVQSVDMITTFERTDATTPCEGSGDLEQLLDLTRESTVCLVRDTALTRVPSSASATTKQRAGGMRIGLNKGRLKSRFNPPKATSSGLKQSTLAGLAKFQYTGKPPRMSI